MTVCSAVRRSSASFSLWTEFFRNCLSGDAGMLVELPRLPIPLETYCTRNWIVTVRCIGTASPFNVAGW